MYYAEFETDKFIRESFFPDLNYKGIMVEVGAGPTTFFSMSKHFRENGWRCVCVDPNPKFVDAHKSENNEIYQFACANEEKKTKFKIVNSGWDNEKEGISYSAIEIKYQMPNYLVEEIDVELIKLDTLLKKINVTNIDFLSVDTEGWEIEVMKGFSSDIFKPKVILLENYLHNKEYVEYMDSIGYSLYYNLDYNYIFKKK